MKKVVESNDETILEELLGKTVTFMCLNYFYNGTLVAFDEKSAKLKDPKIIYETGAWDNEDWSDAQSMNVPFWNVKLDAVESFGESK